MLCKFRNSGQTCISANRIFVQEGIFDAFVERLVEAAAGLKVGVGTEPDVKVGPLIEEQAVEKVEQHVGDALDRGGELLLGGSRHELGQTFFQPTVITGVTADAQMSCDETFGPVAGIAKFATEEEAIAYRERHAVRPRRPTSTARTSAASGASPRASTTGSSGSTPASSRPRSPRSAASRSRASAARARSTASTSGSS